MSVRSSQKDPACRARFYEGWRKTGLPGEPGEYYKFHEENRLTGNELRHVCEIALVGRLNVAFVLKTINEINHHGTRKYFHH
jgi:hypothetical protein